jgi:hypothetical protein
MPRQYASPSVEKLEYNGFSIDIVGFYEGFAGIGIIALPRVYLITEIIHRKRDAPHQG